MQDTPYRTNYCGDITEKFIGEEVKVSGWVENIRDHGGIKFVDLRDFYGIVQVVVHDENLLNGITKESVVSFKGKVIKRDKETINEKIKTGFVEIIAEEINLISKSLPNLPFEINSSKETKESLRLKYRFLDLRNKKVSSRIKLRSDVMHFLRNKMQNLGFCEIQTPILSVSSPEGARDYVIPSRKHKGKFYALPQAPQIFKQLLMVSGFDKYYQIAPCFRDEDSRADRSPGEFYQLDFEMAFANQEDVLKIADEVLFELFSNFSDKKVSNAPFPRIPYKESMLKYGTDKPDLRNPLEIVDLSEIFENSDFAPFKGKPVRGINVSNCSSQSKGFFEKMLKFAQEIGMKGLGYIKVTEEMKFLGPIDKFIPDDSRGTLVKKANLKPNDVLFFISDCDENTTSNLAGQIRSELGKRLNLIDENAFKFCYITDFPMYKIDDETGEVIFGHNPFSMPKGGIESLKNDDPLDVLAYQYDIVCNGVELSSGAVRNHDMECLIKAFEIAGYNEKDIENKFSALYNAFKFGVPPHAGMAPGVDRIVMLLSCEENIREVIAFPMNSNAQDVMMNAPGDIDEKQLRELHIKLRD